MQYTRHPGLPEPDSISAGHSRRVEQYIAERISDSGGSISFAEFMHHALYAPGLGYYAAGSTKFGPAGDFVTAPEISPLFGRLIARQCASVMAQLDGASVLEFGAGSGRLAVAILTRLEELGSLPERYRILEVSADLCERQQALLQQHIPHLCDRIEWLDRVPARHSGMVIANEVLDAMPVERLRRERHGVAQQRVGLKNGTFELVYEAADSKLTSVVLQLEREIGRQLEPGFIIDVSLGIRPWIEALAVALRHGCALLFDYGVSRREYLAPDRGDGWLRCHFRHRAHDNPLLYAGIQDITAWVDFTAVAEAAVEHGMRVAGYVPQSMFLAGAGLDDELQGMASLSAEQQLALSAQIKTLTLPGEMGENIKCMGLLKGPVDRPPAFELGDRTHTL